MSWLKETTKKIDNQVNDSLDPNQGAWGNNGYLRFAESLTGAAAFKTAIEERRQQYKKKGFTAEGIGGGLDYQDGKMALRTMRPGISYKDNITQAPIREAEAEAKQQADQMAYRNSVTQAANDRAARLSRDVRIRRRGDANRPGNKSGTLLTGVLGLLSGSSSILG